MSMAIPEALENARVNPTEIGVGHVANLAGELFCGQAHLGAMLVSVDQTFYGIPTSRHEAACASGSVAVLGAMADLQAGRYDVALVVGLEIERNVSGQQAGMYLGCAAWAGREMLGEALPWPAQFAEVANAYADRWGLSHQHLARIAEQNRSNALRNPNAQTRGWDWPASFGEDEDLNPVVRGMLRKTDCGRITDGICVVVLAGPDFARRWSRRTALERPSMISGWGHRTAPLRLEDKLRSSGQSGVLFPHLQATMQDALTRSSCSSIFDLSALEVHDCFSISEYVAIDHSGLTPPGMSWQAIEDDVICMGGKLPINPSGGLLGGGHPVGATGVRMILDAHKQIQGSAGEYQVDGALRVGTINVGGSFSTAVAFVVSA